MSTEQSNPCHTQEILGKFLQAALSAASTGLIVGGLFREYCPKHRQGASGAVVFRRQCDRTPNRCEAG